MIDKMAEASHFFFGHFKRLSEPIKLGVTACAIIKPNNSIKINRNN